MCSNHLFVTLSLLPALCTTFLPSCHFHNESPAPVSLFIPPPPPLLSCRSQLNSVLPPLLCASAPLALPHTGRGNLRPQLDSAMQDVSDLYLLMEETEKQAVRRALLEERGRYCTFINMLQPVVVRDI